MAEHELKGEEQSRALRLTNVTLLFHFYQKTLVYSGSNSSSRIYPCVDYTSVRKKKSTFFFLGYLVTLVTLIILDASVSSHIPKKNTYMHVRIKMSITYLRNSWKNLFSTNFKYVARCKKND